MSPKKDSRTAAEPEVLAPDVDSDGESEAIDVEALGAEAEAEGADGFADSDDEGDADDTGSVDDGPELLLPDGSPVRPARARAAILDDDSAHLPVVPGGGATALNRYMAELKHHAPITREAEHELAVRWREDGDIRAARTLVL